MMFGEFLSQQFLSILMYSLLAFLVIRILVSLVTSLNAWKRVKESFGVMLFLLISLIYAISPIDFIPDILLVIGWIDDIIILVISITMARKAVVNIIWGDLPTEKRLANFASWYAIILLLTTVITYRSTMAG